MAKLIPKAVGTSTIACYSERGILAYVMYRVLPKTENLALFLQAVEFTSEEPTGTFCNISAEHFSEVVIFSELDFGTEGFGKPDGAIYFKIGQHPYMFLIEAKINETYQESCEKQKSYNSTIKGQLELRWRAIRLVKTTGKVMFRYMEYYRETLDMRDAYCQNDVFYRTRQMKPSWNPNAHGSFRRLKIDQGVKGVLAYIEKCDRNRIFFLAISKDDSNPFTNTAIPPKYHPECMGEDWKRQCCWLRHSFLESLNE